MSKGRLAGRFVSWLEEELGLMAAKQPKQTPDQIMNQLRKNPRVSMEEISDRGFDQFLATRDGALDLSQTGMGTPMGFLERSPVPMGQRLNAGNEYAQWATPNLVDYRDRVMTTDGHRRGGSPSHFPNYDSYHYHTRGGTLPNTNVGRAQVLDEVQSGIGQRIAPQFDRTLTQQDTMTDAYDNARELGRIYSDPPFVELHDDPRDMIDNAIDFRDQLGTDNPDWDLADQLVDNLKASAAPYNAPAKERFEWQALAHGLDDAIAGDADALVWPSGEVQYNRYFGDDYPSDMLPRLERQRADMERLDAGPGDRDLRDWAAERKAVRINLDLLEEKYGKAQGSEQMYRNQYDRRMPRDKRWKQLGLKPELVDLEDGGAGRGKYWTVRLTPEIKERLAREGIPYYAMGGMAVLGQQEGAFDGT